MTVDLDTLKKSFTRNLNVPSLPIVVMETLELLSDEQAGTRQIGAKVAEDPPLTVKLLRVANSALYGSKVPIHSTEQAAAVLGFDAIRNMLMQVTVVDLTAHLAAFPDLDLEALWRESRICAKVARDLPGTWSETLNRDDAHLCGLLHNIGVFVLLETLGEDYVAVLDKHRRNGKALKALELEAFQLSHDQVGFLVARRWQLPTVLLESIRYHLESRGRAERSPAVAVTYISRVITEILLSDRRTLASKAIPARVLDVAGLGRDALDLYVRDCRSELAELGA